MPKKNLVSFVVLNWNGLDDTLECLKSIRDQSHKDYEIIVVDNGSSQDQKEALGQIKDIRFIDLPQNTGFTGGQLAAYKIARGEFIALINNDAVLAKDWCTRALKCLEKNSDIAAVGGRAYEWSESKKQKPFEPTNSFYSYQVVNLITGHTKTLQYGDKAGAVDSISGAAVMIRRSAVNKCGYFYRRFFAYYEETDLFARFKRAGLQIWYEPGMATWHKIAQSSNRAGSDFFLFHMHRNRFIFAMRNYDRRYSRRFFYFYLRETTKAFYKLAKIRGDSVIEERNMIRAFAWNMLHIAPTLWSRRSIKRLGPTYSKSLLQDKAESITAVITCYNYGQYVGQAIESLLNQTQHPDEIIVINDGSTDDSLQVINRYKDKVKIINQANVGVIKSKNRGLREAQGEWILFLDADDYLDPTYLETHYKAARRYNADIVYGGMKFLGGDDGVFDSRPFTSRSLRHGNYIHNSAVMRRQLVLDVGGYKAELDFGYEDWELYLTLAEHKARFRYVKRYLLNYRRHETMSRDKSALEQLQHAYSTVRRLHPRLFSFRNTIKDWFHDLLTIHQRRTILQVIRDFRYLMVKRLDRASESRRWLNKLLGFSRLLFSGNLHKVGQKICLNIKRLFRRVG